MTIRIIAGTFGGRRIGTVAGRATRPLLAQVREAIFNILGDEIANARVWDLFAGTGANGIEALSRGARAAVFIESSKQALRILRRNLEDLGDELTGRFEIVRGDAWRPPERLTAADIVFLDPPFASVTRDPLRALRETRAILQRIAPGGRLVFHYPPGAVEARELQALGEADLRRWGSSWIALFRTSTSSRT